MTPSAARADSTEKRVMEVGVGVGGVLEVVDSGLATLRRREAAVPKQINQFALKSATKAK